MPKAAEAVLIMLVITPIGVALYDIFITWITEEKRSLLDILAERILFLLRLFKRIR